jgi:WD40 repeat protein
LKSLHIGEITCFIHGQEKFLSTGLDGFIKDNSLEPKNLKLHYLSPSGVSCACRVDGESYAVANMYNNIHLFNLKTGKSTQQFYAHDDKITAVLFRDNVLITCSLDYLIKVWDLSQKQITMPVSVHFEHCERIFGAALHPT